MNSIISRLSILFIDVNNVSNDVYKMLITLDNLSMTMNNQLFKGSDVHMDNNIIKFSLVNTSVYINRTCLMFNKLSDAIFNTSLRCSDLGLLLEDILEDMGDY
jgi:hypothetical protein